MSKYEELAFQVGKTKTDLAALKSQLVRLKNDLDQFLSRKPDGAVVQPLRERIKQLEADISAAETSKTRDRQVRADALEDAAAEASEKAGAHPDSRHRSASTRFPPRRRL